MQAQPASTAPQLTHEQAVQHLQAAMAGGAALAANVQAAPPASSVPVSQLVQQDDLKCLKPEINETFLLTGVPPSAVKNIMAQGFNERFLGANAG